MVQLETGRYQSLVGRLIYLSHTKQDIANAVSVVGQFMHDPSKKDMELQYLKPPTESGIPFNQRDNCQLKGIERYIW